MRAVVTGSATPMGWPRRGGPGQSPAASSVCAVTPLRTAAWISGMVPGWCGRGSVSGSDQRPPARVKGTVPSAPRSEERMTGVSALAVAAPIWPLTRIGVPGSLASRRCAAAGSASAPKPASAVVTATEVRIVNRRLAASRRADPSRRSTNDARAPRTLPACAARAASRWAALIVPMVPTLRTRCGRAAGAGQEWLSGCHVFSRTPGGFAGPLGGWAGPSDDGRTPGSRGRAKSELLMRLRNT